MTDPAVIAYLNALDARCTALERKPGAGVWVDYSATSTITGWSAYSTKHVYYMRTGNLVFVAFVLYGTSNSTEAKFTLPYTSATNPNFRFWIRAKDNGGAYVPSVGFLSAISSLVTTYADTNETVFTASGTKSVAGQFWYAV